MSTPVIDCFDRGVWAGPAHGVCPRLRPGPPRPGRSGGGADKRGGDLSLLSILPASAAHKARPRLMSVPVVVVDAARSGRWARNQRRRAPGTRPRRAKAPQSRVARGARPLDRDVVPVPVVGGRGKRRLRPCGISGHCAKPETVQSRGTYLLKKQAGAPKWMNRNGWIIRRESKRP